MAATTSEFCNQTSGMEAEADYTTNKHNKRAFNRKM